MYVAPSILSADFGNLAAEIRAICEAGCDLVHVDVMDGHFVPNLTIGPVVVNAVAKAATKPLDIHLMVENNSFFADLFLPLKPKFLTFHIEEEKHPMRLIDHIRKNGVSPGIVLNPHTPVSAIEHIIDEDGGVNGLNAPDLEEAGADILVAGSYIFSSNSYEQAIRGHKA